MDIDYFLKINNSYGMESDKDIQLYNLHNHINDRFNDTINTYKVEINNEIRDLIVVKTSKQDEKKITSRPNEDFNTGDYVRLENKDWLIISKDVLNQAYTRGIMKLTNYSLTFQHPETGEILSYPCINERVSTTIGEQQGKTVTTLNAIYRITLPLDEITILFKNGQRFFLDKHPTKPQPVKVVDVDTTTEDGLVILTTERDLAEQPNDRPDLGVCDYFEPTTPLSPTDEMHVGINVDKIIFGINNIITPTFYNNGEIVNDLIAKWEVVVPTGYENDIKINYMDNSCSIILGDNYGLIGKMIAVTISDEGGSYSSTHKLEIGMGW